MSEAVAIADVLDATPVVCQWTCHYCKRGFETQALKCFRAPAVMVCCDCEDAYDAKVLANFVLLEPAKQSAYAVANMEIRSPERREIIGRWHQFAGKGEVHSRVKFIKLIQLVNDCDSGKVSAPQTAAKKKGKGW